MLAVERTGTGIPLVFVHAWPLSRKMWEKEVERLSRNFQVIAFDLPGFGDSRLPSDTNTLTMENAAQSVLESLDELGISDKAVFVGLSMGGYVLFQIWRLAKERVRAFVFASTRASADTPEAREKRFQNIKLIEEQGLMALSEKVLPALIGKSTFDAQNPVVEQIRQWIQVASPEGVAAALRGMADRPDSMPILSSISVPSLVLSAQEDALIPADEMEAMADLLPESRFETLEKAGHLSNLEQPALFYDSFSKFLKRSVL